MKVTQIKVEDLIPYASNARTHSVICCDCGDARQVRKDSKPKRCWSCAARIRGAKGNATIKARVETTPCAACGTPIPSRLGYTHCSVACRKSQSQTARECKTCGVEFTIHKSALSGKTNSAGNFCSRPCYEKWMCRTERTTGRGSQWNKHRKEAVNERPFCAMCGTKENLQVHHVVPFRLTHDNGQDNLIPLCRKCHKVVETLTHDIEATGSDFPTMKLAIGSMLREHQDRWRLYHSKISA